MNRILLALVAATLGVVPTFAHTRPGTVIALRSPEFHHGSNPWTMCQMAKAGGGGEVLSKAGYDTQAWSKAIVPGTVLNSLVANGAYPEPYFGLNNAHERKLIPDISETGRDFYTYWFRTEFAVPKEFSGKQIWLEH